jgi:type I restriction enzyme S subunit
MKAGWKTVRLGEILTERREIPSADDLAFGRVPVVAKIRFDTGKMELRQNAKTSTGMIMARPGDLLISGINAAKGAIAICDAKNSSPVAATIHYSAYSSKEHLVDRRYLWLFLRSRNFQELLQQHIPGGIKTELKAKRLLPIPIPLPPLPEQRRIVARIEKLVEKIDTANELHKKSAEDANTLIQKMADRLLCDDKFSRISLRNLLSEPLMNGLSVPASKLGSGICFAKAGVVNSGIFNQDEIKYVDIELDPDSPYWLQNGDIVVSRGNSPEFVGRAAVYENNPQKCAMPDLLIRVRLERDKADAHFVSAFFHTTEARNYIAAQISGTSSTMPKISQTKLEKLTIPVPSLPEQRRIVAELDALQTEVDALKRLQAESAAELDALLPAVLDRAFKGEL